MNPSSWTQWLALQLQHGSNSHKISPNNRSFIRLKKSSSHLKVDFSFIFKWQRFILSPQLFLHYQIYKLRDELHLQPLSQSFIFTFLIQKFTTIFAGMILNFVKLFCGLLSCLIPFLSIMRSTFGKISFDSYL